MEDLLRPGSAVPRAIFARMHGGLGAEEDWSHRPVKDKLDRAMELYDEPVYEVLVQFQREHPEARDELEKKVNPPPRDEEHLQSDRWA